MSGRVCEKHERYCPDGVCPYCDEPSLFGESAAKVMHWSSAPAQPVTTKGLVETMNEMWRKLSTQQAKPRSRTVSPDWWRRMQDTQNGVQHSPECEERWTFWHDRIDFWPEYACDYHCPPRQIGTLGGVPVIVDPGMGAGEELVGFGRKDEP